MSKPEVGAVQKGATSWFQGQAIHLGFETLTLHHGFELGNKSWHGCYSW